MQLWTFPCVQYMQYPHYMFINETAETEQAITVREALLEK